MILLDTDHINVLQDQQSREYPTLMRNISLSADQDLVASIVSCEEQMRGWLALIHTRHVLMKARRTVGDVKYRQSPCCASKKSGPMPQHAWLDTIRG